MTCHRQLPCVRADGMACHGELHERGASKLCCREHRSSAAAHSIRRPIQGQIRQLGKAGPCVRHQPLTEKNRDDLSRTAAQVTPAGPCAA
jgi:hypothetical protein